MHKFARVGQMMQTVFAKWRNRACRGTSRAGARWALHHGARQPAVRSIGCAIMSSQGFEVLKGHWIDERIAKTNLGRGHGLRYTGRLRRGWIAGGPSGARSSTPATSSRQASFSGSLGGCRSR